MQKINWQIVKQALLIHYTAPLHKIFKQFRDGAIFFAVGMIIIYLAGTVLESSLNQELIILAGLIIAGAGFIVAMLAQIRMVISRIILFLKKP